MRLTYKAITVAGDFCRVTGELGAVTGDLGDVRAGWDVNGPGG